MAMIYGGIKSDFSKSFNANLTTIQKDIDFVDSKHYEINWKSFKGGILVSKSHPYSLNELHTIDKNDSILVLFSGVIYNTNELVANLEFEGITYSSAELILLSYKKWGNKFVSQLNGDFAIFIYDESNNVLLFYRDHIGIKGLAYTKKDDDYFFSSDAFGLCKSLYKKDGVDKKFLLKWVSDAFGLYSILPSNKVQKIKPGHYISINNNNLQENKYWFPEKIKIDKNLNFDTVKFEITKLLKNAVHVRSDQRFFASAHVSGGLDSSIVASFAKKEYNNQKEFYGFSWSSADATIKNINFDERQLVRDTCKFTGIKEIPFLINTNDVIEYENDWRISTYLYEEVKTRKDAQKLGVNLLFSGWGGDEFLSINSRGIDSDLFFNFQWSSFIKKNQTYNPIRLAKILLVKVFIPAFYKQIYFGNTEDFKFERYFNLSRSEKKRLRNNSISYKSRQEVHLKLLNEFHLADRAEDWAVNGCRKGIEYRYPLLDINLIEYMLKVPSKLLFKKGYARIILREISEGVLPDSVRWHNSKFDEAKFAGEKMLLDPYCKYVMNNPEKMESDPLLNFINFKLLFEDTRKAFETSNMNYSITHCRTVLHIKKMHNFIEAYKK
jgi:asparagine synthase (glutamine-hydrolysing)